MHKMLYGSETEKGIRDVLPQLLKVSLIYSLARLSLTYFGSGDPFGGASPGQLVITSLAITMSGYIAYETIKFPDTLKELKTNEYIKFLAIFTTSYMATHWLWQVITIAQNSLPAMGSLVYSPLLAVATVHTILRKEVLNR